MQSNQPLMGAHVNQKGEQSTKGEVNQPLMGADGHYNVTGTNPGVAQVGWFMGSLG